MNNQLNNNISVTMIDIKNSINKLAFNIERLTELFTQHLNKQPIEINITPDTNTETTETNQNNTLYFPVQSKTSDNQYIVRVFHINNDYKRVLCSCNDFLYRKQKNNKPCKHINSIIDEKYDSIFNNSTVTYN
tara:strand:- start:31 stop:429 length:399 start_codon:yes stop_codon:yes gene_type:complete